MKPQPLPATDWILVEAVRLKEEQSGRRPDDQAANALARSSEGTMARRLATRARALPGMDAVRLDVARLWRLFGRLATVLLVLAAVIGALAARASVAQRQVDILLAAAALLALPTLMLLLWLVLIAVGTRSGGSGSLTGHLVRWALRWLGPRILDSNHAAEVAVAGGRALLTPFGRWLLGALTHAFWSIYLASALAVLVVFFSIAQYDLYWGTTILADRTIVTLVGALAELPARLGVIPPPEPQWILSGREGDLHPQARARWAHFLLAVVLVYGLLPRLLLLGMCGVVARLRRHRLPLDVGLPGYLRLAGLLRPATTQATPHGSEPASARPRARRRRNRTSGKPVLIGLELESEDWTPAIPGMETRVLGMAKDRDSRRGVLAALEALDDAPPLLLVSCSLPRTPDAAAERFINRAADLARTLPVLLLTEHDRLQARGIRPGPRLADWQALAERVGGEALLFDPDAPDAATVARLRQLISGDDA